LALAARHHRASGQILAARSQSLTERPGREAAAYQETIDKRGRRFQADWGNQGRNSDSLARSAKPATHSPTSRRHKQKKERKERQ
jgi:hypothetical protein